MLKKARIVLALLCWLSVTLLILDLTGATRAWIGWLAKVQFLPAVLAMNIGVVVLWVVLTLLVGRIYCSVICPLGVFQDFFSHLGDVVHRKTTKKKVGRFSYWNPRWSQWLRYGILGVFVVSLFVGFSLSVQWLAPYSSYGRIVTSLVRPLVWWVNEHLANWSAEQDNYVFYHVTWGGVNTALAVTAFVSASIVVGTSILGGRFYCNEICPVGAFLGLLSKKALFRIQIDEEKCVKCGLCEHKCKAMAIDSKHTYIDHSRCVDCFNCLETCHTNALAFGLAKGKKCETTEKTSDEKVNPSRRAFLVGTAAALVGSKLKAAEKIVDGGLATIEDKKIVDRKTPICPPGALSLKNLQQHCTGCQLCVASCPNGVLHPSTDMMHYMQPTLSYENAHCRPECHACSDVCPAGAILPLGTSHEEKMAQKSSLKIGRAVWVKENCLPASEGVSCGNCARRCPSGAISMVPTDPNNPRSIKIPVIDEERCIGCGACEHLCPARPFTAIYVEGIEVQRNI